MPSLNKRKTVIYGVNKDASKMQEIKAKEAGDGRAVFFSNPQFIREDDYELEEHIVDAGKVIIIGQAESHRMFERVKELHEDQAPGKPEIKFLDSPAIEAANKKQKIRNGESTAGAINVPTDDWNKDKIQAWLTLNDIEFEANAKKAELLELVEENS